MRIVCNVMSEKKILRLTLVTIIAFSIIGVGMSTTVSAARYDFSEPTVSAYIDGDNTIESGETKTFNVQVINKGDNVLHNNNDLRDLQSAYSIYDVKPGELEGVGVNFEDDDTNFDVKADTVSLNRISSGVSSGQQVRIESSENLEPGRYNIPVEVEYTYVFSVFTSDDDYLIRKDTVTEDMNIEVNVEESADLEITSQESIGLYENAEGQIRIGLRNKGSETARDATVRMLESENIKPTTNGINVGTLESGESSEAVFQASALDVNQDGNYSVGFEMLYEDNNGNTEHTNTEYASVKLMEGPTYDIETEESELYVNSLGRVEVEVENMGDSSIEDAQINMQPEEPFSPVSSSSWIGNLKSGENATATFKLDVSDRAVPQSYPVSFVVEHSDYNDNRVQGEILTAEAKVNEEKSFDVLDSAEISVGTTETVEYEVQNTGDSELKDATVRINSNSPFETDDDTSYVGTLEPGEKETVTFKMTVESSATVNKTYSLDATTKFKNEYGDTVTTDTVSAPIKVVPDNSLPLIPIIGGAGAVIGLVVSVTIYKLR